MKLFILSLFLCVAARANEVYKSCAQECSERGNEYEPCDRRRLSPIHESMCTGAELPSPDVTDKATCLSSGPMGGCVSTFNEFQSTLVAIEDDEYSKEHVIAVCGNANIEITSELVVHSDRLRVCCKGENIVIPGDTGCTLDARGNDNRIFRVEGESFTLEGLRLYNGKATRSGESGGNLLIRGGGHHLIKHSKLGWGSATGVGGNLRVDLGPNITVTIVHSTFGFGDKNYGRGISIGDPDLLHINSCPKVVTVSHLDSNPERKLSFHQSAVEACRISCSLCGAQEPTSECALSEECIIDCRFEYARKLLYEEVEGNDDGGRGGGSTKSSGRKLSKTAKSGKCMCCDTCG